jgi:glycerol-3-phosphate acyltransferase PlsY
MLTIASKKIPFSLIIGNLIARTVIRTYGDGNPGGTNGFEIVGVTAGISFISLDMYKGFLLLHQAQEYCLGRPA